MKAARADHEARLRIADAAKARLDRGLAKVKPQLQPRQLGNMGCAALEAALAQCDELLLAEAIRGADAVPGTVA
jgi:hypothetical protein